MKYQVVPVVLSLGGALLFATQASAQIQFNLDTVFDGTNAPPVNPTAPWITAEFEDLGNNQVLFTLDGTANLGSVENLSQLYFNFDDSLSLDALSFAHVDSSGLFDLPTWTFGENLLKADGDGKYDIRLDFTNGEVAASSFGRNESVSYLLSYGGPELISGESFNFLSQPAGGSGPFLMAAHVQNTTGGGSAWLAAENATLVPVPEPSAAALLWLATVALLGRKCAGRSAG